MAQLCNFGGSPSSGGSLSPQPYGQPSPTGQQPTGYVGFSPVQLPGQTPTLGSNQASPVQFPSGQAQGSGGMFGAMAPRPMSQRDIQMMARYLPGSGTTVDPNASPNALANRFGGNFRNMVPQRLQGRFDEMQRMAGGGGMGSYQDALNNPVIGAMIRRKGYL